MKASISAANKIFRKISKELLPEYKGKIVAIETESGNYFIGENELEAYKRAKRNHPDKQFVFKRIGFDSTFFVGALYERIF